MDINKRAVPVVVMTDDEDILRETYQIILNAEGFKAYTANSGKDGLKLATQVTPDVVLLDMLMPDLGGLEFLEAFQAKKHPETKIYVLSNLSDPDQMRKAMELGAWKYLVKADYTPTQIVGMVKEDLAAPAKS